MKDSMLKQIADLQDLSHEELRELWKTLHGGYPPAYNRRFIISRLVYRIQELAYGGLSDQAKERMNDMLRANGFDDNACDSGARRGRREKKRKLDLPVVGARLIRDWNGHRYEVIVVHNGFEFEGRVYRSLTAVAKAITGTHQSGRAFFGLQNRQTLKARAGERVKSKNMLFRIIPIPHRLLALTAQYSCRQYSSDLPDVVRELHRGTFRCSSQSHTSGK